MGGMVVSPSGRTITNLYIRGGTVAFVDDAVHEAIETIDAVGFLVLPGMVDTHVHLMDPGDSTREDFPSGSAAAAASGVTTIIEHTHGWPLRSVEDLDEKVAHLTGRSKVDFGLAAHVWADRVSEMLSLWEAGVAFFKIFTCTTHGVPAIEGETLTTVLEEITRFGGNSLIHCEDESLTLEAEQRLRQEGRSDPGLLIDWRNREAEEVAAAAVIILARHTGARATIAHVSTPRVAALVAAARAEGADVVAEGCPQYFHLREEEVHAAGALRKFTPPARIRSDEEHRDMWDLLRAGAFSHISTDHAPSTLEQKTSGTIWEVHFGLPGLDTTMPLLMTAAVEEHLSWEDVVKLYAESPARRYSLHPAKGHLAVGADADFLLVDPERSWTVGQRPYLSKAGWSPYEGTQVRGWVHAAYQRGSLIAVDGVPLEHFNGRFLARATHDRL